LREGGVSNGGSLIKTELHKHASYIFRTCIQYSTVPKSAIFLIALHYKKRFAP